MKITNKILYRVSEIITKPSKLRSNSVNRINKRFTDNDLLMAILNNFNLDKIKFYRFDEFNLLNDINFDFNYSIIDINDCKQFIEVLQSVIVSELKEWIADYPDLNNFRIYFKSFNDFGVYLVTAESHDNLNKYLFKYNELLRNKMTTLGIITCNNKALYYNYNSKEGKSILKWESLIYQLNNSKLTIKPTLIGNSTESMKGNLRIYYDDMELFYGLDLIHMNNSIIDKLIESIKQIISVYE